MQNFAERAKTWLDDQAPDLDQIGSAYLKMNQRFEKMKSELCEGSSGSDHALHDVENCIEVLIEKFSAQGGDIDVLLGMSSAQPTENEPQEYKYDASPLLPLDDDEVPPPLTHLEKQAAIQNLKQILRTL